MFYQQRYRINAVLLVIKVVDRLCCIAKDKYVEIIKNGEKFAAISFWRCSAYIDIKDEVYLGNNLYASPRIPFEVTPWWREQLGAIQGDEIENSDFFIVATMHSNELKILNNENEQIIDKCRKLFFAFLLSGYTCVESSPKLVTGSSENNVATFRSISDFEHPKCIMGTRPTVIDMNRLENVYNLYNAIVAVIYKRKIKGRLIWAINCFLNGIKSDHIYEKIRNFIRAIEAFILPESGKTKKQFKSRTEIFIGTGKHELMNTIYEVRSAIEHLHDPLEILPGKSNKEKFTLLLKIGLTVEYMARFCINRFLGNADLWDHFSKDENIKYFWTLNKTEQRNIWGEEIDLSEVEDSFESSRVIYNEDPI